MISALFPLVYISACLVVLVKAFRLMKLAFQGNNAPAKRQQQKDRTGLVTTHPEILDDTGRMITEDLMAVRFSESDGYAASFD